MDYPHDQGVWERMMEKQVSLLNKIDGVTVEGQVYHEAGAPYRLGLDYEDYKLPGFLLVQLRFNFPAIMDCRATPTQKRPHPLTSTSQVRVSSNHEVQLLIPRTFNGEPITGDTIYFGASNVPKHCVCKI